MKKRKIPNKTCKRENTDFIIKTIKELRADNKKLYVRIKEQNKNKKASSKNRQNTNQEEEIDEVEEAIVTEEK